MGDAFTSQGMPQTAGTPEPRGQAPPCGLKRPPTLQTDGLLLDFRHPKKGECILCPLWRLVQQRGVHRTLCSAGCVCAHTMCVLCRHEPPREPATTPARSPARHGREGMGAGSSQVRTGRLYEGLRLVGSKPGGGGTGQHMLTCREVEGNPLPGSPGGHRARQPAASWSACLPLRAWGLLPPSPVGPLLTATKATPVSWQQLGLLAPSQATASLPQETGLQWSSWVGPAWGSVHPPLLCPPTPPQGHLGTEPTF